MLYVQTMADLQLCVWFLRRGKRRRKREEDDEEEEGRTGSRLEAGFFPAFISL